MKKNILGNWNLFDILLLSCSMIAIICCSIFSPSFNIFSLLTSVIGIIYVFFVAKKLLISQYLGIIYICLYVVVAYQQNYFGEAITNLAILLPVEIISIFVWLKNRSSNNSATVSVNKISKLEVLILVLVQIGLLVGSYFFLRALNTEQLIINTININLSTSACYLKLRRVPYFQLLYCASSLICLTLWILTTINSGLAYLPMVVNFVVLTALNVYSFINWNKKES